VLEVSLGRRDGWEVWFDEVLSVNLEPLVCFVDLTFPYSAQEEAAELLEPQVRGHIGGSGNRNGVS